MPNLTINGIPFIINGYPAVLSLADRDAIALLRHAQSKVGILGDVGEAMKIADQLNSGIIHINEQTVADEANIPFGGVGASGTGSRFGGAEANIAKIRAAEAGFEACDAALQTHGGMGYAKEFHVERYLREALITRIAPISPQLILSFIAEKALGLPKSY